MLGWKWNCSSLRSCGTGSIGMELYLRLFDSVTLSVNSLPVIPLPLRLRLFPLLDLCRKSLPMQTIVFSVTDKRV
jgi:hypothetical protein